MITHGTARDQLQVLRDAFRRETPVAHDPVAVAPANLAAVDPAAQYMPEVAASVAGHDPDALARAAQQAATIGAQDPLARQVVNVEVQPRLLMQGQSGPVVIPVDIAVPAAETQVRIAPPTTVVVDPATGQAIAETQAAPATAAPAVTEAAPASVTAKPSWRNAVTLERLGQLGQTRPGGSVVAPASAPAVDLHDLIRQLHGAAATVNSAVEAAPSVIAAESGRLNLRDAVRTAMHAAAKVK